MTEKRRTYLQEWRRTNSAKVKGYSAANYRRHRKRKLAQKHAWRLKNPAYMAMYHKRNATKLESGGRNRAYVKKFGISLKQYDEMFVQQNGACALCRRIPTKVRLAVDHDHITGRIRGLLCMQCNSVVVARVENIGGYLKRLNEYVQNSFIP